MIKDIVYITIIALLFMTLMYTISTSQTKLIQCQKPETIIQERLHNQSLNECVNTIRQVEEIREMLNHENNSQEDS